MLLNVSDGLRKTLWLLFMDGVQLSQGYRATTRRVYFLRLSQQEVMELTWSISEGRKDVSILEASCGFEPRTPGLGIQCSNHEAS